MPPPNPTLRFLQLVLWEDWSLKIVCFVLATLSWLYIDGELKDKREILIGANSVDLDLPEGMALSPKGLPVEFRVEVHGPRRRLQYLTGESVRIRLREAMENPVPGPNAVKLRPENILVQGMPGAMVSAVKPQDFDVELLRVYRRPLPVKVRRRGNPRPGFRVEQATPEPDRVIVTCTHDLSAAENVWTMPIEVTGRSEDFQEKAAIDLIVALGDRDVQVRCDESVTVSFQIRPEVIERTLEDVSIAILAPPGAAMSVDPSAIRVSVKGSPDEIGKLRPADVRLYVEWPAEWELRKPPPSEVFPPMDVPVKVIAPARVTVLGENGQPLPSVKVRGALSRSLGKP